MALKTDTVRKKRKENMGLWNLDINNLILFVKLRIVTIQLISNPVRLDVYHLQNFHRRTYKEKDKKEYRNLHNAANSILQTIQETLLHQDMKSNKQQKISNGHQQRVFAKPLHPLIYARVRTEVEGVDHTF